MSHCSAGPWLLVCPDAVFEHGVTHWEEADALAAVACHTHSSLLSTSCIATCLVHAPSAATAPSSPLPLFCSCTYSGLHKSPPPSTVDQPRSPVRSALPQNSAAPAADAILQRSNRVARRVLRPLGYKMLEVQGLNPATVSPAAARAALEADLTAEQQAAVDAEAERLFNEVRGRVQAAAVIAQ